MKRLLILIWLMAALRVQADNNYLWFYNNSGAPEGTPAVTNFWVAAFDCEGEPMGLEVWSVEPGANDVYAIWQIPCTVGRIEIWPKSEGCCPLWPAAFVDYPTECNYSTVEMQWWASWFYYNTLLDCR